MYSEPFDSVQNEINKQVAIGRAVPRVDTTQTDLEAKYKAGFDDALKLVEAIAKRKFGPKHKFMQVIYALQGD